MGKISGKKSGKGRDLVSKGKKIVGKLAGKSKGGGKRRHGVNWYANQVLKEKLKKKLRRLKYGGV